MNREFVRKHFDVNALSWILDGYGDDGFNYPVGFHRVRVVEGILTKLGLHNAEIVDLGCGGGHLAFQLASQGHSVTGVDQAPGMIELAERTRASASAELQHRVRFVSAPLQETGIPEHRADVVTAMGVIGYLDTDVELFEVARRLLKPGGHFIVSCRNRLFNLASIGFRTKHEVEQGTVLELIEEFSALDTAVPERNVEDLLRRLKEAAPKLPHKAGDDPTARLSPSEKHGSTTTESVEARQHTPVKLGQVAAGCGFRAVSFHGIHPHLIDPRLNALLPPRVFNTLSGCLEALEDLPISLAWSSVFIGTFQNEGLP